MNKLFKILKNFILYSVKDENPKFQFDPEEADTQSTPSKDITVKQSIEENLSNVKDYFNFGISGDIKIREFKISGVKAFILFIEGMVNTDFIDQNILKPLMLHSHEKPTKDTVLDTLITHNQAITSGEFKKIASSVNFGDCAIFVDNVDVAIICDVKTWDRRGIDAPLTDAVIMGPHEGFNENFKINTALVRKIIRDENLIIENLSVGAQSKTPCAFMYMKNIANDELVEELKKRINNISCDYIYQVSELEQFIEDSSFSLVPQMLKTERPDKTAESLIEGKIAVILQGSPFALVLPITISEFFTTVEDKNLRFPYSNMIRIIRLLGILASILLPGFYISILNFHHEMIPTNLLFAIEATREAIPFSALTELIIMEISFDLIREASIRVPSPVGSTLGIIGGLIIGQAAVSANVVSPISIIIVALAGIGSFATPDYSVSFGFRLSRYFYTFLGSIFGFLGLSLGIFINISILCNVNSLGVSMMKSLDNDENDNIFRYLFSYPIWKRELRHSYLHAKHQRVQQHISRKWAK
ncbi:MAG: spore germination protein [Clostridia bacterium]|nr:spore germination protein [Clostridia bacterium]